MTYLQGCSIPVVPKVGYTAPKGTASLLRGALQIPNPPENVVHLITIEVASVQTLGHWYHFMKNIRCIKNVLTVK
jgi:hypothetical protein